MATVRELAIPSPGLAERLAGVLARKRMKAADLAKAIGVSKQTISNVLSGERITRSMAERIGGALGVGAADLVPELGGGGAQPMNQPAEPYQAGLFPRELRAMALRFLAEANEAGADEGFLRYAKHSLEDPELATLYAGGLDEDGRPMTAEEQRDDYEAVIDGLRLIMKRRLARARANG